MESTIDHLLFASSELGVGIDEIERLTGVRPCYGGQHLGLGTHNALVSLGPRTYLEVIAPDPSQGAVSADPPFDFSSLRRPALRSWAVAPRDIEEASRVARAVGVDFGEVVAHSRRAPDGRDVRWRMTTHPGGEVDAGEPEVVPFLIDWGESVHPATSAPQGVFLSELRVVALDVADVQRKLLAIGIDVEVRGGAGPALEAVLVGSSGQEAVLRS